ncbi:hypothetical protein BC830DRAFT_1057231 [Chytriomyces sp. MP71]|nr:hypothetical protein BC830DRAFT_1057231 [Chytriomyces sp. MP71]
MPLRARSNTVRASGETQRLLVRIGSSTDDLRLYNVNDDENPAFVDGPLFVGRVTVRVKGFDGITPDNTLPLATEYWGNRRRIFSVQFQGRFKEEILGEDLVQLATWDRPVKLPFGSSIILNFATMLDSTFSHSLLIDKPWTSSTVLSSQNTLSVRRAPAAMPTQPISISESDAVLGKWVWGGEVELEEDSTLLAENLIDATDRVVGFPFGKANAELRRKHFQRKRNREAVKMSPDFVYAMESYTPHIDFNSFDVNMGLSINMMKYTDNQPHTVVFKSVSKNQALFAFECRLVDVDAQGKFTI